MYYGSDLRKEYTCSFCSTVISTRDEYGNIEPTEDNSPIDGICLSCFEDTYSQCSECGEYFYIDEIENSLCETCEISLKEKKHA